MNIMKMKRDRGFSRKSGQKLTPLAARRVAPRVGREGARKVAKKVLCLLALTCVLVPVSEARAASRWETTCSFGDCAHWGWETTRWDSDEKSQTQCFDHDCLGRGWKTTNSSGAETDVRCKTGGCLVGGWKSLKVTVDGKSETQEVTCNLSDCAAHGWHVTTNFEATADIVCLNGDCAHVGWEMVRGGEFSYTGCKLGQCLSEGWTTDVY